RVHGTRRSYCSRSKTAATFTSQQQVKERAMTIESKSHAATSLQEGDANLLQDSVREMVSLMGALERKLFIKTLEYEMLRAGLRLQAYLAPLGIAAAYADELTPTDVGQLISYFRINVPVAMLAVARSLGACPVFATGRE